MSNPHIPMEISPALRKLMQRGCDFLGVKTAIMAGAMTWVSEHRLVAAISNAGGFGVLACGSMTPALLAQEIQKTRAHTQQPFAVNIILLHPALEELLQVCIQEKVAFVVLAGGFPSRKNIQTLKEAGIKVMAFAPALPLAKKLLKEGVDALIVEGHEAGGHIGPVSTAVLAQEILPVIQEIPVFVAGGIGRGEAIVSWLEMGAAGCQLGTRFVCAAESIAHPAFKQAFIRAQARDAVVSVQYDSRFPVIPVRALANKGMQRFLEFQRDIIQQVDAEIMPLKEAQLAIEHFWAGALRRAVLEGDIENGSLMAGQSVGMVERVEPVADIIQQLLIQAEQAIEDRRKFKTEVAA